MANTPEQTDKLCAGFCLLRASEKRQILAVAKAMVYAQTAIGDHPSTGKEPPHEKSA